MIVWGCRVCVIVMPSPAEATFGGEAESVTLAVKSNVPTAVGVPEIIPVPESRLRPVGREPSVID